MAKCSKSSQSLRCLGHLFYYYNLLFILTMKLQLPTSTLHTFTFSLSLLSLWNSLWSPVLSSLLHLHLSHSQVCLFTPLLLTISFSLFLIFTVHVLSGCFFTTQRSNSLVLSIVLSCTRMNSFTTLYLTFPAFHNSFCTLSYISITVHFRTMRWICFL